MKRRWTPPHPCPRCERPCFGKLCRACYAASKPPPVVRPALQADWRQRRRRAQAVQRWVKTNGPVCPGYNRPPHPSNDLTADHLMEVALGGREDGPLGVLCRGCNSVKSNLARAAARRVESVEEIEIAAGVRVVGRGSREW